jgi:hypothetical protein
MFVLTGCGAPGETWAEVNRRHHRVITTDMLQLQSDLDAWLLLDRPSRSSQFMVR